MNKEFSKRRKGVLRKQAYPLDSSGRRKGAKVLDKQNTSLTVRVPKTGPKILGKLPDGARKVTNRLTKSRAIEWMGDAFTWDKGYFLHEDKPGKWRVYQTKEGLIRGRKKSEEEKSLRRYGRVPTPEEFKVTKQEKVEFSKLADTLDGRTPGEYAQDAIEKAQERNWSQLKFDRFAEWYTKEQIKEGFLQDEMNESTATLKRGLKEGWLLAEIGLDKKIKVQTDNTLARRRKVEARKEVLGSIKAEAGPMNEKMLEEAVLGRSDYRSLSSGEREALLKSMVREGSLIVRTDRGVRWYDIPGKVTSSSGSRKRSSIKFEETSRLMSDTAFDLMRGAEHDRSPSSASYWKGINEEISEAKSTEDLRQIARKSGLDKFDDIKKEFVQKE